MNAIHPKFSWLRLVAAISVAFIASASWIALWCDYFGDFVGAHVGNAVLGFFGVLFGSLCFQRQHRAFGSIILLVLGVAIDVLFEASDFGWVAIGGVIIVAFCYWRRPLMHDTL